MMIRKNKLIYFAAALLMLCALSCAGQRFVHEPVYNSPDTLNNYLGSLKESYPGEMKLKHRIVLDIMDKHYDFIGYMVMKRNHGFRAAAYGEMAGKLFDFSSSPEGDKILFAPPKMPPRPILDGVMNDIKHVYYQPEYETAYLEKNAAGETALICENNPETLSGYKFSGKELKESSSAERGRVVRRVQYSDYESQSALSGSYPKKIIVENKKWYYRMEIYLLDIQPVEFKEALLK